MFIDTRELAFVKELEAGWQTVRDECRLLPENEFEPWVQREMYGEGWSVYGLIAFGERIEPALARCPKTAKLLESVPRLTTAGFSRLTPGAHIQPHVGWVKSVYRAHLGLVVPAGCALRVGSETREWSEGTALVFDDTVEHEAWNRSSETRTVLLFDFVRPGLSDVVPDIPPREVRAGFARPARLASAAEETCERSGSGKRADPRCWRFGKRRIPHRAAARCASRCTPRVSTSRR